MIFLGLGSNLSSKFGDRFKNIKLAISSLELYGIKKLPPSMINTCFSLVSSEEGISVSAVYHYDEKLKKIAVVEGASGVSPESSDIVKDNAWDWAKAIWDDMLT